MQITKLTITPLAKGWPGAVIENPSASRAGILIKERLVLGYQDDFRQPRVFRKIPKILKGFVNPATKMSSDKFIVRI